MAFCFDVTQATRPLFRFLMNEAKTFSHVSCQDAWLSSIWIFCSHTHRFRSDHLTKTIPLSEVNETKVAMLDSNGIEAETEAFYKTLFLIQDLYASGYRMADVGPDENGLVNI